MNTDRGYLQAVANMAWKIAELSDRDAEPIMSMFGTEEEVQEYITSNPHVLKDWEQLDGIAQMICKTYNVTENQLHDDVWQSLLQLMYDREGKVN